MFVCFVLLVSPVPGPAAAAARAVTSRPVLRGPRTWFNAVLLVS